MIDPYALRLGNLVMMSKAGWQVVHSMDMLGINLIETPLGTQRTLYSQIEPIILTPEILTRNCGFLLAQQGSMAHPEIYSIRYKKVMITRRLDIQFYSDYFQWIEGNDIIDIKSLHELQNFYHWLAETELPINY